MSDELYQSQAAPQPESPQRAKPLVMMMLTVKLVVAVVKTWWITDSR
jgi:hypothetical protein